MENINSMIMNPKSSHVYRKMNNQNGFQNPEGSYVYRNNVWAENTTPSGSHIARILGFSINMSILRIELLLNQLKEAIK